MRGGDKRNRERRDREDREHGTTTVEQASKLGLNFNSGRPPTFKAAPKKEKMEQEAEDDYEVSKTTLAANTDYQMKEQPRKDDRKDKRRTKKEHRDDDDADQIHRNTDTAERGGRQNKDRGGKRGRGAGGRRHENDGERAERGEREVYDTNNDEEGKGGESRRGKRNKKPRGGRDQPDGGRGEHNEETKQHAWKAQEKNTDADGQEFEASHPTRGGGDRGRPKRGGRGGGRNEEGGRRGGGQPKFEYRKKETGGDSQTGDKKSRKSDYQKAAVGGFEGREAAKFEQQKKDAQK